MRRRGRASHEHHALNTERRDVDSAMGLAHRPPEAMASAAAHRRAVLMRRPADIMTMPLTTAVVYIVDDDPSVCRALSRLIRSVGLEVETFESATAFLDQSPPDRPACLVLDIRLPGPSGLDLQ